MVSQVFAEENGGRFFEVDGNFCGRFRKALPDAHVNRHISPAPVVDVKTQSYKCLRLRGRLHVWLLMISRNRFPIDRALGVLAAHNVRRDLTLRKTTKRSDHLDFFVANTVGAQIYRRFHRDKTKKLEQMVLHHVAQSACTLVKTGATLNPQRFSGRDLHVIDVMRVPERRENRIRESQDQNVLRGFLSEKMIYPVSLILGE